MRHGVLGLAIALIAVAAPLWADDQQIADTLVQRLQAKKEAGELRGFAIDLEVQDGTVVLKGHVSSPDQQALVLDVARRIEGVKKVVNGIQVRQAAEAAPQGAPARPLAAALLQKPADAEAEAREQVAQQPVPQATLAQPAAPPVQTAHPVPLPAPAMPPAEPVELAVRAQPLPQRSDHEIAHDVAQRLQAHQQAGALHDFDINISVQQGSVWLKGRVASPEQHRQVLEIARRVPGVTQVVNDLTVQPTAMPVALTQDASVQLQDVPPPPAPAPEGATPQMPLPFAPAQAHDSNLPLPETGEATGVARARFDNPHLPAYAWPSYAAYPNYAALTYPRQYSPAAWPYIGPFYPYPQVPLGWRTVQLKWKDGWWFLDFKSK